MAKAKSGDNEGRGMGGVLVEDENIAKRNELEELDLTDETDAFTIIDDEQDDLDDDDEPDQGGGVLVDAPGPVAIPPVPPVDVPEPPASPGPPVLGARPVAGLPPAPPRCR